MVQASTRGRPISWAVVLVILVGSVVAGIGLITGPPTWWLFAVGVVITVVGTVVGWLTGIMEDVH